MTELSIRPDEIRDALQRFVADYQPEAASREEVGTVAEAGDGIARVSGLPSAMANELLEFEDGTLGIALNLDTREIGVVVLGDFAGIEEGQTVRRTGEILSVPVGDDYLGRVVDPLGTPIGRGQRQLIIGDRQTGKSTILLDTIINQKQYWDTGDPTKQVRCIYVAIGQKGSTIAAVRGALEEAGALEYTTIVASPASDSAGFKYLAPYTGSADGQIFLQSDLFNSNQRPAIDVGVSVSRVGSAAMTKAMKKVTGSLKVDLAQFRAMEAFAMFASDLDAASRQQLDRGQRLMALLKQPAYSPYPLEEMTVSLWAGTSGKLDNVPADDVLRFEREFIDYLKRSESGILDSIRESRDFSDDTAASLEKAFDSFADQFETSEGGSIKAGKEEHEALEDEDVEQEQIVKQKRG